MVFKNPKHVQVKLALQEEKPQEAAGIVADYIFGDDHEESDVSWLLRVADHYSNDSSYTSISEDLAGEETPTSKYSVVAGKSLGLDFSPPCKKKLSLDSEGEEDGAASIEANKEVKENNIKVGTGIPSGVHEKLNATQIDCIMRRLIRGRRLINERRTCLTPSNVKMCVIKRDWDRAEARQQDQSIQELDEADDPFTIMSGSSDGENEEE